MSHAQEKFFAEELKNYIEFFRSSLPIDKHGKVFCPGDVEENNREYRRQHGVPLPISTWESIIESARNQGISHEEITVTNNYVGS